MLKMTVIGHLGRDAEIKDVNGKKLMEFSVAETSRYEVNGVMNERTTWVTCSDWSGKTNVAPYLKKGTQVYIEGIPSVNTYTNKEGQVVGDFRLRVQYIQLLGSKNATSNDVAGYDTSRPMPPSAPSAPSVPSYDDVKDDLPF